MHQSLVVRNRRSKPLVILDSCYFSLLLILGIFTPRGIIFFSLIIQIMMMMMVTTIVLIAYIHIIIDVAKTE